MAALRRSRDNAGLDDRKEDKAGKKDRSRSKSVAAPSGSTTARAPTMEDFMDDFFQPEAASPTPEAQELALPAATPEKEKKKKKEKKEKKDKKEKKEKKEKKAKKDKK